MDGQPEVSTRLFLAADIIGSTARKQGSVSTAEWSEEVFAFYHRFPQTVKTEFDTARLAVPNATGVEEPQLWKAVGDELIFTLLVTNEAHVEAATTAFVTAMRQYMTPQQRAGGPTKSQPTRLKGGAWLATFPYPNVEAGVPSTVPWEGETGEPPVDNLQLLSLIAQDPQAGKVDFIGPSMDIGFRVTGASSERRFTLSLETAWAVAASRSTGSRATENMHPRMFFGGEAEMRGVWKGAGYPLFWLDVTDHNDNATAAIDHLAGRIPANLEKVRTLAKSIAEDPHYVTGTYLSDSTHGLNEMSAQLKTALAGLQERVATEGLPMPEQ